MKVDFNSLPWHDAELVAVNIDRSNAGRGDNISLLIKWPDGRKNDVVFEDCYFFDAKMNFGVVAKETILEGVCLGENDRILEIKKKWQSLGISLDGICCYRIITNSTNSKIEIYALSYMLS
ncbi:hypothetical protein NR756_02690 [Alloalcanivorax xenomutans]|uniref:hypothetical protein n=1 Tax=Alloalcanivorax xenomutans TaxID=1094342 RepID=UPI003A803FAD